MSLLFLALAALLQVLVIPGQLAIAILRLPTANALERILYGAAISLFVNHALVLSLVTAHLYTRASMLGIFAAELLLASVWINRDLQIPVPRRLFTRPGIWTLLLGCIFAYYAFEWLRHFPSVFTANDDVASWDRWAMELSRNALPTITKIYPQLIPASWSIFYVWQGTTVVKAFAKGMMPLFSLGLLLTFVSLKMRRSDSSAITASVICAFLLFFYLGPEFAFTGYVDIPLAFFAFLSFYPLYASVEPRAPDLCLAILFASATALTKQGGLYVLGATLLYWFISARHIKLERRWKVVTAISLATVAAWYGYKAIQIYNGQELSHVPYLIGGIHEGRTPWQRLVSACRLWMPGVYGKTVALFFAACTIAGLLRRATRFITAVLILPLFFVWALLFSYEIRTASMLFPFLALVVAKIMPQGQHREASAGAASFYRIRWQPMAAVVAGILCFLAVGPLHSDRLMTSQAALARKIGDAAVNEKLYELDKRDPITGAVLTNYWHFQALPELGTRNRFLQCGHPCSTAEVVDQLNSMEDVSHLLVQEAFLLPETAQQLPSCAALEPVMTEGSVRLYRIQRAGLATCVSGRPR